MADGQPGLARGWEVQEVDPRVYRKVLVAWGGAKVQADYYWWDRSPAGRAPALVDAQDQPAPDGSIHEAMIGGVVERARDLVAFWRELYRVCAHGAQVTVAGPYWTCVDSQADPTRRRGLSEQMFVYLSAPGRAGLRQEPLEDGLALDALDGIDFDPVRFVRVTKPEWASRSDEAKSWALVHSVNVCWRLDAVLIVHKPPREPPREVK